MCGPVEFRILLIPLFGRMVPINMSNHHMAMSTREDWDSSSGVSLVQCSLACGALEPCMWVRFCELAPVMRKRKGTWFLELYRSCIYMYMYPYIGSHTSSSGGESIESRECGLVWKCFWYVIKYLSTSWGGRISLALMAMWMAMWSRISHTPPFWENLSRMNLLSM